VRVNAYLIAGDPAFLTASVNSYYEIVNRIIVSYDANGVSWAGGKLAVAECLAELRQLDGEQKIDLRPGEFSNPELPPGECETRQRRDALLAASEDSDWVLQLDTDEVIPDASVFVEMLVRADRKHADGLDFPSRWLYAHIRDRLFLEACTRWWRPAAGYPGSLAVRSGTSLRYARQCEGQLFRCDFRSRNTDPWRPRNAEVDTTVPLRAGVLHFSWVRTPDQLRYKAEISPHRFDVDWETAIRKWEARQRHPLIAMATTPLRRMEPSYPVWLRVVEIDAPFL